MKKNLVLMLLLLVIAATSANAQVTIGSENAPHPGALLDLRQSDHTGANSTKGLLLPRVNLTAYDELTVAGDELSATGMIVWNTNAFALRGVGTYQWDGTQWVEMKAAGIDYGVLPNGTATFIGKTCFDIVYSNDNANGCALLTERASQAVDFSNRTPQDNIATGPYTGVQIYTFTTVGGAVSKVRFAYEETVGEGFIVESVVPSSDYSTATGITSAQVTVSYKTSLQTDLQGKTSDEAFKLKLYAIYNANSDGSGGAAADRKAELTIRLQDCACCVARTRDGGWLTFMCHNLGANENLDPFEWNNSAGDDNTTDNGVLDAFINGKQTYKDIKGYLFQWGRAADGHQYRNSSTTSVLPTTAEYIANPTSYTSFIRDTEWVSDGTTDAGQKRWGEGTATSAATPKRPNDPCPPGWKVPSRDQWISIYETTTSPNVWTWTGNGYKVGDALYLPSVGVRNRYNGGILNNSNYVGYWGSTYISDTYSHTIYFTLTTMNIDNMSERGYGRGVRCVEE